ncbi:sugar metabolism cluster protein [Halobiforma nitratireducens JCM 10879]|uniref:Sugar metabolism cluster protein n=1 Tax=Halobiforma nitratireducens JCM 10879 TaxID=1227454 RepID=M0MJP4_9EURY|nr:sugar metabolism cluster protein [Halobiforma nitratireducens JCM 10879]
MVGVAAIICYGSLVAVPDTVVDDVQPDLIAIHHWRHLVAYFTLACSVAYATDHWELPRWKGVLLTVGIAASYGIGIEFGQALVPHRSDFLLTDVTINAVGASGVVLWYAVRPYVRLQPVSAFVGNSSSG